ncbi:hypothetical protein HanRHA438_Chr09g0410541 [Helianthus annuus]|uniref:RlpA-like double-psi beta-barrel domain-containing protein n=1 Tax=Helianthus annuus TaxID=4232 RepID=A0A9K3I8B4_HELAN|nr:hypothetical protein HanXRQr2_Chr09g0398761 [Helianthus annuus]KAJ0526801.1 hypothetical protein HanHA300_Chr09g0327191 [Helianthus annuus]KAJ0535338.1 hypothetical protein HanIR_Chr09g0429611 [Helianthus annuus]KAJ0543197.1 hypothetical protein HanHA89_Chr09g0348121 [Helianthus annuus]KAJ0708248.1 hypothetical protein HanLR1_Chr09g0327411 [Helianthus annuus]
MNRRISFYLTVFTALLYQIGSVDSVVVPATNCYSNWNGHLFEYDGGGYVGFGKFEGFNYFVAGSEHYNFVQVSGICIRNPSKRSHFLFFLGVLYL